MKITRWIMSLFRDDPRFSKIDDTLEYQGAIIVQHEQKLTEPTAAQKEISRRMKLIEDAQATFASKMNLEHLVQTIHERLSQLDRKSDLWDSVNKQTGTAFRKIDEHQKRFDSDEIAYQNYMKAWNDNVAELEKRLAIAEVNVRNTAAILARALTKIDVLEGNLARIFRAVPAKIKSLRRKPIKRRKGNR
jgi:chromosome segregation ATPase